MMTVGVLCFATTLEMIRSVTLNVICLLCERVEKTNVYPFVSDIHSVEYGVLCEYAVQSPHFTRLGHIHI